MTEHDNPFLSRGLDYYKATMSQVEFEKTPDETVTFALKNRSPQRLSDYCSPDELRARLDELRGGWRPEEIAYLASLVNQVDAAAQFRPEFLDYLLDSELPPVEINLDERGDLSVRTTGPAPLVTFWETVIMSEINEIYFRNKCAQTGTSLDELYAEGDRRLDAKIARLQLRPDIRFSDFGTRRRFSYEWQQHVIERLARELPDNFTGTSNIYLAHTLGLKPIGTFAHELPMIYAGLADGDGDPPLYGHHRVLDDWQSIYRGDLSTALTDTFGSEFFFDDVDPEHIAQWQALRHDSGDPFDFGERVIEVYERHDIDPTTKTIVFSDGLDIDQIIALADYFNGKIQLMFGWGTTLTNDLGRTPNNFVMKAVAVNNIPSVKLSDVEGKHTGPPEVVERYIEAVKTVRAMGASAWQALCREADQRRAEAAAQREQLWHDGPNYTADAVIINGDRVRLIWRAKDQMWALPGGFVDESEDSLSAARREAMEECHALLNTGDLVYRGRVDDPRTSRTRWIETDAYLFLTEQEDGQAGDDANDICWAQLDNLPPLYGSHREIIAQAVAELARRQELVRHEDQWYAGISLETAHPRTV